MTAKVTDLEQVREAKKPICDYCGEEEHKGAFQCQRIRSVEFDNENDTVLIRLWGPVNVPGN